MSLNDDKLQLWQLTPTSLEFSGVKEMSSDYLT